MANTGTKTFSLMAAAGTSLVTGPAFTACAISVRDFTIQSTRPLYKVDSLNSS